MLKTKRLMSFNSFSLSSEWLWWYFMAIKKSETLFYLLINISIHWILVQFLNKIESFQTSELKTINILMIQGECHELIMAIIETDTGLSQWCDTEYKVLCLLWSALLYCITLQDASLVNTQVCLCYFWLLIEILVPETFSDSSCLQQW